MTCFLISMAYQYDLDHRKKSLTALKGYISKVFFTSFSQMPCGDAVPCQNCPFSLIRHSFTGRLNVSQCNTCLLVFKYWSPLERAV